MDVVDNRVWIGSFRRKRLFYISLTDNVTMKKNSTHPPPYLTQGQKATGGVFSAEHTTAQTPGFEPQSPNHKLKCELSEP